MSWQDIHPVKVQTIDTLVRVVTVVRKLPDYAAAEALLQAARAVGLASGHSRDGRPDSEICEGNAASGECALCRAVHFIEAALQEVNPSPEWQPRLDPDLPRIILPGT